MTVGRGGEQLLRHSGEGWCAGVAQRSGSHGMDMGHVRWR